MNPLLPRLRHLLRVWKASLESDSQMEKIAEYSPRVASYYRGSKDALKLAIEQLEEVIRG